MGLSLLKTVLTLIRLLLQGKLHMQCVFPDIIISPVLKAIDIWRKTRIIDGLGLIRLFFWFSERCFWASSVVHVVSVQ